MSHDLTKGPVIRTMLLFAFPMMVGNLLQQLYNVADTLIVGQFLGADALAAVGYGSLACGYRGLRPGRACCSVRQGPGDGYLYLRLHRDAEGDCP